MNLPWLKDNIDQWLQLLLTNQLPHAVLLSAAKGIGKSELSKSMAHIALCERISDGGVCGSCNACHLLKVNNHPDLTIVSAEKAVIKVEQIRELTKNITLSSTRNQHKVIIIENAEQMNKAAANALLKTLEEPPENVVIILTTCEMGRLLATIKSRCIKINIRTPTFDTSFQWLSNQTNYSREELSLALALTNGSPFIAKIMLQENTLHSVKEMLSELNLLKQNNVTLLDVSKRWSSNNLDINFPYLAAYFLTLLKSNISMQVHESVSDLINLIDFNQDDINQKLLKLISRIFEFEKYSQTPLKKELLIEELLIHWQREFKLTIQ
jgi:DNA polymerase-3 subunit delta'